MPEFEIVTRQEAISSGTTGRRSQLLEEYARYIQGLGPDTAGD